MLGVKKRLLLLVAAVVIFLGIATLSYLLFWGGNSLIFQVNTPSYVVDKIRSVEKLGGDVQLTAADFNALLQLQIKDDNQSATLKVDGMFAQISNSKLTLSAPIHYHGLSFLVSTVGELVFKEGNMEFRPDVIKVGKIQLPIEFILGKLGSHSIAGVSVKDNRTLEIPKAVFPFTIQASAVKGDKLILTLDKASIPQQVVAQNSSNSQGTQGSSTTVTSDNSKIVLLKRAKSQLSSVYSAVTTQQEKSVIGQIQTVVGKMIANPSYSYTAESQSVKTQYHALSSEERSNIEDTILMKMDINTLREIKSTFGL